jgi:gliding motility-associated-like protein
MVSARAKQWLAFIITLFIGENILAQYTVNGNAAQISCNEYRLTQAVNTQSGSVWNNIKIDLNQSFDFNFDVILSAAGFLNDGGADGIAFVLQPISTSVGTSGGGLGYEGVNPAVGVTIDTYQNPNNNDPTYDHIAIQLNGDIGHSSANNIAGPVTALSGNDNIEDGVWHSLHIQWDATTKTFSASVDGVLRVSVVRDFVNTVFGGNPLVYWGFTGSTGGLNNYQGFKTALNPSFGFSPIQKRCVNEPITFNTTTISFTTIAKFYWDFGDGSPIDSVNLNPVHTYINIPGDYIVKQKVIGADGCEATNTQTVRVGSRPAANFLENGNNCNLSSVPFLDQSVVSVGTINSWLWDFGNSTGSTLQNPTASYTLAGPATVTLSVATLEGCTSSPATKIIQVYSIPAVDFTLTDSVCLGQPTYFFGSFTVAGGLPVNVWNWNIDNNGISYLNILNPSFTFLSPGNHNVMFFATTTGSGACLGIKVKNVFVRDKPHAAIKNQVICPNMPAVLQDSSYTTDGIGISNYWWDLGNGQFSTQKDPMVTYNIAGPVIVKHVVTDARGCISDTLTQTINLSPRPFANFGYSTPVCNGLPVQFSDSSKVTVGLITKWSWVYNGVEFSSSQNSSRSFTAGPQTVKLVATGSNGCVSDTAFKTFVVNPNPDVSINFKNACKNVLVDFKAVDNSGTVSQWKWIFGDGATANTQNAQHAYNANGTYKIKLIATAGSGCFSDSLTGDITIFSTNVFAGKDTIAAAGQPVQLNAIGGLSYTWTPATSLNDPNIGNPIAVLNSTQIFTVKAFTPEGCESYDDVTVHIYKGPDIYLPNAFTPNGDTKNDLFKGTAVGIKQFNYLKLFNRWGQLVFSSSDHNKGWDGRWQGKDQPSGVYIVLANGIDFKGNIIDKRQTVMLIR